jgi:dTMP kinase
METWYKGNNMFITFEGMNGSGKSTQAKLCVDWLGEHNCEVVHTREPGGTPGAEDIRNLILNGDAKRWSRETEVLLFNAARCDHVERLINPALSAGKIVISDRYVDSTIVLQTLHDQTGELRRKIDALHMQMIGRDPDLTILIDISLETARRRIGDRTGAGVDRMEKVPGMLEHEYNAYQALANQFPERIVKVSGEGSVIEVASLVRQLVQLKVSL